MHRFYWKRSLNNNDQFSTVSSTFKVCRNFIFIWHHVFGNSRILQCNKNNVWYCWFNFFINTVVIRAACWSFNRCIWLSVCISCDVFVIFGIQNSSYIWLRIRLQILHCFEDIFMYLRSKYSCRRMTIVGGLIAAGGGLISFFAFSIWHFLLSFAFITGIGLSFCFNSAIVAVTYYFQVQLFFSWVISFWFRFWQ